jgi:hypothetical protein
LSYNNLEGFWFLLEDLFVCHVEISDTSKTLENINWPKEEEEEEEEEETKAGTHEMEPTPKSSQQVKLVVARTVKLP